MVVRVAVRILPLLGLVVHASEQQRLAGASFALSPLARSSGKALLAGRKAVRSVVAIDGQSGEPITATTMKRAAGALLASLRGRGWRGASGARASRWRPRSLALATLVTALLALALGPAARPAIAVRPPSRGLPQYVGPIQGHFSEHYFFSDALSREMWYQLYLPPGYQDGDRAYPVLYLLHGASGNYTEWPAYGFVDMLDRAIVAQELPPFIAVLPQGDFGYWINHAEGGYRWGDYVTYDLVGQIDSTYRTVPRAAYRAIGGLSMGGSGALVQAFTHPAVFGVVGAHGPSLREDNSVVEFLGTGTEFAERDPISLARTAAGIESLRIMLDTGPEDPWYARAILLHEALLARGVPHVWQVWPGGHDGNYWSRHTPEYLHFYGDAFRQ